MNKLHIIIIIFACFCLSCHEKTNNIKNSTIIPAKDKPLFNLVDSINYYTSNGYIPKNGILSTDTIAVKVAEIILFNIYGENQIKDQRPYNVVLKENVWIIEGDTNTKDNFFGGTFYIELSKETGAILKIIHTK